VAVWGYYGILAFLLLALRRMGRGTAIRALAAIPSPPAWQVPLRWAAPPLVLGTALVWAAAFTMPDGHLRVTFLDVGQGDAILVQTPSGRQVLVDGGPDPEVLARALGNHMPFWDRSLDVVVLTHPHEDHVAGLTEALRRYRIGLVVERTLPYSSPTYAQWRRAVEAEGARHLEAAAGQQVHLGDGVVLRVLNPPDRLLEGTGADEDNNSVVLRLDYGNTSFLLAGEVHEEAERLLVRENGSLHATVLKVAHHGSDTSTSAPFLAAVSPALAVISVGADNRFGHPSREVMKRLRGRLPPERLLLTSTSGAIQVVSDGLRLWLRTER
jgi:competence protein ComEC